MYEIFCLLSKMSINVNDLKSKNKDISNCSNFSIYIDKLKFVV